MIRVGVGYDVHRFGAGRRLVLGGVDIDYESGLEGHSDADVLIHAVIDALLGAAALGDIGSHFPPTDSRYKDIDSRVLLRKVMDLLCGLGWRVGNIDTVIVAEKPRLAEYIPLMRANISADCRTGEENISVKATTEEGLGLAGQGIGAHCSCVIEKD